VIDQVVLIGVGDDDDEGLVHLRLTAELLHAFFSLFLRTKKAAAQGCVAASSRLVSCVGESTR